MIGNYIGVGGNSGGAVALVTPSALSVLVTGAATQTITATIAGSDFDSVSFEYSTDNVTFTEKGTSATNVYNATGLTAGTFYYWRARLKKGSVYGAYSPVDYDETDSIWYLNGGVSAANCVAAYQAVGATSLANSYKNLNNPGTNDAAPGTAPTLDSVLGWVFDGSTQYLTTGVVPANDQTWTMIARCTGYGGSGNLNVAGIYHDANRTFYFQFRSAGMYYGSGKDKAVTFKDTGGLPAILGNAAYKAGVSATTMAAGSGTNTYDIWIGALHYTSASGFWDGEIQALSIYNTTLSPQNELDVSSAMFLLRNNRKKCLDYVNLQFGALICWNMCSFTEDDICAGNLAIDTFAPSDLDIDQWLDACVAAGMKYAILTTKHHDGFALWPTAFHVTGYAAYGIASTTWYANNGSPDIVSLFVTKCRARNLKVGLYFSIWDETWETRTGKTQITDTPNYVAMIQTQLTELLSNYGTIDVIWLDGWKWHLGYQYIGPNVIFQTIKAIQPNCVIFENSHTHPSCTSQIEGYEHVTDGHIAAGNTRLSEETNTIRNDIKWFYHSSLGQTSSSLRTESDITTDKNQCNSRRGTYLLGISPGTDGHLPAAQVTLLESL